MPLTPFISLSSQAGRLGSTKIASAKRSSNKLLSSQPDPALSAGTALPRQKTSSTDLMSREAEGQQGAEQHPVTEKFSSVGRNSLDIFSPTREGETLLRPLCQSDILSGLNLSVFSDLHRLSDTRPGWRHALWKDTQ